MSRSEGSGRKSLWPRDHRHHSPCSRAWQAVFNRLSSYALQIHRTRITSSSPAILDGEKGAQLTRCKQDGECLHRAGAGLFEFGNLRTTGFHFRPASTKQCVENLHGGQRKLKDKVQHPAVVVNGVPQCLMCADFSSTTLHQVSTSLRTMPNSRI